MRITITGHLKNHEPTLQFYAYPMTRKLPRFWNNVNVNLGIFGENLEWLRFLHQFILLLLFRFLHQPIYSPIKLSHRTNFFSKYLTYLTLTSSQFMPFTFPKNCFLTFGKSMSDGGGLFCFIRGLKINSPYFLYFNS